MTLAEIHIAHRYRHNIPAAAPGTLPAAADSPAARTGLGEGTLAHHAVGSPAEAGRTGLAADSPAGEDSRAVGPGLGIARGEEGRRSSPT